MIPKYVLAIGCIMASLTCLAEGQDADETDPGEDVRAVLKMSPKDVLRMRREVMVRQDAQYREIRSNEVLSDETVVTLSHNDPTPTIYLMQRAPTSLSFVDITGSPWPVQAFETYDGELLGAKQIENQFLNSVVLHGKLPAGATYVTVFLKGLAEPISAKVVVDNQKYHKKMVVRIEQVGPDTVATKDTISIAQSIGTQLDPDLNSVLFGVTPFEAHPLVTDSSNVLAWRKGDAILVRTNLSIIAPGHTELHAGSNGYVAYKLPDTTRITATNDAGKVVYITLKNEDQI